MKRFSKILVGVFLSIVGIFLLGIFLFRKFLNKKDVQVKKTKKKKQKRRVRETKNVITPSYEEKNTITISPG